MRFALPQKHKEKDSTSWRKNPYRRTSLAHRNNTENTPQTRLAEQQVKQGVLEGSIYSEAWDTACTSHVGIIGDPFIQKEYRSTKIFALADGQPTPATNISKLERIVQESARTFNMVPALDNQSLLSGGKFVEARYVPVCNG